MREQILIVREPRRVRLPRVGHIFDPSDPARIAATARGRATKRKKGGRRLRAT